jgi:hypothetical protein
MKDQMKLNIDLKATQVVKSPSGNSVFAEGTVLRKGSKFLLGTDTDPLIPIPVLYDIETNKILLDMIPKEIREEYKDIGFSL